MKWEEIQHHLEPDNIGTAPMAIKGGVFAFLFIAEGIKNLPLQI